MIKMLIVDDEEGVCDSISHTFSSLGYKTFTANSSKTALEIFKNENPDLIFLDIIMPGVDGLQLLRSMKTINHNNVIIMVSARGDDTAKEQAKGLGAHDFITKPFSSEMLQNTVSHYIDLIRQPNKNQEIPNILIADDEQDVTYPLKSFLSKRINAHIEAYLDGATALHNLLTKEFDIALIDIGMPGVDGITILKEVKAKRKNTDVIIITGWTSEDVAKTALAEGATKYLTKPVIGDHLFNTITPLLVKRNKYIPKN